MKNFKNLYEGFLIALSFFTTIPVGKHYDWILSPMRYIPVVFSLVGVIIGAQIGEGIVPIEKAHRIWRDNLGFFYQAIAAKSTEVYRV